jgi:magnesium transporter
MLSRHEKDGLIWIDLESPTRAEVISVMHEFNLDPFVGEDLLIPSTKPRSERHESYMYLVLHFPALRHSHKRRDQEVDFLIGRNFLITTHYEQIDPVHNFAKAFKVDSAIEKGVPGDHAGFIFYALLKRLYKSVDRELDFIKKDLSHIEERIFSEDEVHMVSAISETARDLLNLRQIIEPHRDALHTMESDGLNFFGAEFGPYLKGLSNEYYKVHNHLMRLMDSLHELRETNNSLLSTKQNETMKIFTIMAFFTFPLSLIATLLAVHAKGTPFPGTEYDFWIILGCMIVGASTMFLVFRYKKWL